MATIIGLDFGTCFSSVFFRHGDQYLPLSPETERDPRGLIPTAFYYGGNEPQVGSSAIRRGRLRAEGLSEYVKRRYRADQITLSQRRFTPAQIVEEIVRYLMNGARSTLHDKYQIRDDEIEAVLTIPVTYGEEWKQMLQAAVEAAGVRVHSIIPEPVAAALWYMESSAAPPHRLVVYDLGGGTTDVSMLEHVPDMELPYRVIDQDGTELGGNDWDDCILRLLEPQILPGEDPGKRLSFLERNRGNLLKIAEEIKTGLTEAEAYDAESELEGELHRFTLTRAEFEDASRPLMEDAFQPLQRVINRMGDFDELILVGGGSRMPQVMARMRKEFPGKSVSLRDPECSVAIGAAIWGNGNPVMLLAPHSYGILYERDGLRRIRNLILQKTELPAEGRMEWPLTHQAMQFMVYEGSDTSAEDTALTNHRYAISATAWLRKAPGAGARCFAVLRLDNHGMLRLDLLDENGGQLSQANFQT